VLIHLPQPARVGLIEREARLSGRARSHEGGAIYARREHRGLSLAPAVVHTAAVGMGKDGGDGLVCLTQAGQTAKLISLVRGHEQSPATVKHTGYCKDCQRMQVQGGTGTTAAHHGLYVVV
jgi:hypothetical protein